MNTELQDAIKALHAELRVSANGYGAVTVDERSLRTVLDALSSPPADDVREALASLPSDLNPDNRLGAHWARLVCATFEVRPYGTVTDTEAFDRVRSYWRLIRGAQMDMLNGRPDMSAMEEIALASAGMDDLLMTSDAPEARS